MEIPLPPVQIRQGGGALRFDDDHFVTTAREDADFLRSIGLGSRLLDFGCGPGRLAIGLIACGWSGSYLGVEVKSRHVRWASRHLTRRYPNFQFVWVDAPNPRYNPDGSEANRLPVEDDTFDTICAFSVFSHLLPDDTRNYLAEFHRVLGGGGIAYITAYMADDVPDVTENPPWLGDWSGRLHCVLYSTDYLTRLISGAQMSLEVVSRSKRKQVGLLLRPAILS